MIYEFPESHQPIRQGDIFFGLPRIEISLSSILVYDNGNVSKTEWKALAGLEQESTIVAGVRSVIGIVASQDCDLVRARDVTFCEVRRFQDVEKKCKETKEPKSWNRIITQQARLNFKWFYLPPDEHIGFVQKMAADFQVVFRVPRSDLEAQRSDFRKGRLNRISEEHFRQRVADFFRRYPYDEWYPLDDAEMEAYAKDYPEATRFPWQKTDV